jgi:hypothetical protein
MSLGGAQVTKLRNYEVAPIIHINLNLPPHLRYRNENILLSCLIPGPKKHGLLDTLYPMVEEMKALHTGIPNIYNNVLPRLCSIFMLGFSSLVGTKLHLLRLWGWRFQETQSHLSITVKSKLPEAPVTAITLVSPTGAFRQALTKTETPRNE